MADGMGLDCGRYKWQQNQSHVEVAVHIPPSVPSHQAPLLPCLPPRLPLPVTSISDRACRRPVHHPSKELYQLEGACTPKSANHNCVGQVCRHTIS